MLGKVRNSNVISPDALGVLVILGLQRSETHPDLAAHAVDFCRRKSLWMVTVSHYREEFLTNILNV